MSCCATGPTGSNLCSPPIPVTTIVAGPQGPTGPQGPQGLIGPTGPVGVAGPSGATGPLGPIGLVGQTGPVGPTGPIGSSAPVAFFSGFKWGPAAPYHNGIIGGIAQNLLMSLGAIPFATGQYLVHLNVQLVWNSQTNGTSYWDGNLYLNQRFGLTEKEGLK